MSRFLRQSSELTGFYNAYHEWLEDGADEDNKYNFKRNLGLKEASVRYARKHEFNCEDIVYEQELLFQEAFLDTDYPFGGKEKFIHQQRNRSLYLDINRVSWVGTHLNEEVEKVFILR